MIKNEDIFERYSDAKEIWLLSRRKKMSAKEHIFDAAVALLSQEDDEGIIRHKDMALDIGRCQLTVNGQTVDLTRTELALMEMFIKSPGRVFTREQIFERGWGDTIVVDDNTIRVTIFEPFKCSDESRQTKDGSGLGLAISKRIAELHGGRLYIDDNIDGYTKSFVIELKR